LKSVLANLLAASSANKEHIVSYW